MYQEAQSIVVMKLQMDAQLLKDTYTLILASHTKYVTTVRMPKTGN